MLARSSGGVDRPIIGRSAAAALALTVALIVALAVGAAAARASDEAQAAEQTSETEATASAIATTPETAAAPASAPAPADAAPAPAPADPQPAPQTEQPAEPSAPQPAPETPEPASAQGETPPPGNEPTEPMSSAPEPIDEDPAPAEPQPPPASATAQNRSEVWQAVFQVQQGCRSHCRETSQSQSAIQVAETIQSATAIGGGTGAPGHAPALNESTTGQFIWQVQLGCVAFCYGTSQTQAASQWAATTQTATALADGSAAAHNVGSVIQQIWQIQYGCQTECYRTSQTQSSTQGQSTTQSATATVETWGPWGGSVDAQSLLPAWLVALARNVGVTIQTVWQYQEADCLENCVGASQDQSASQVARVSQIARAVAGIPPKPPTATPTPGQPPAGRDARPKVAHVAGAASSANPDTTSRERVSATWRRVRTHGSGGSRIRQRARVAASASPGNDSFATLHSQTRVSSNTATSSSIAKVSVTARSTTKPGAPGSTGVQFDELSGPGTDRSRPPWLLLGLMIGSLVILGATILRKARLSRPAL